MSARYPGTCLICGRAYIGRHPDQQTCCHECGHILSARRTRERHARRRAGGRSRAEAEYQRGVDKAVEAAKAGWSGDPFAAQQSDETIYGNMVWL